VARSYGGINVKIDGDYNNKDIKRAISDLKALENNAQETQGKFSGMSNGMKIAGAAIAAAAAAAAYGVVRFAGQSISAASDLEESLSKARTVFGSASSAVEDFAESASVNLGLSRQAALEATGTFGNLFTAMGIGQGTAAELSNDVVQLAGDLASFNNLDVQSALDALRSGLVGETEPLRRLGVNLSAARIEGEAFRLGLARTKDDLDAAAKAQAAWSLITKDAATASGDFARTSDSLANTQRTLTAAVDNARASIGEGLVKALQDVVSSAGGPAGAAKAIETFGERVGLFVEGITIAVSGLEDMNVAVDDQRYEIQRLARVYDDAGGGLRGFISIVRNMDFDSTISPLEVIAQSRRNVEQTTEAWADYRRAQQGVVNVTPAVVDSLNDTADAAANTARSGAAAAKALLSYAISTGQVPDAAKLGQKFVISEMLDNIGKDTSTASSRASKAADTMRIKWAEAAQGFTDAAVKIEGKAVTVSGALGKAFQERAGVFREVINTQVSLIQQAQQELDTYADSVTNAILGKIDFSQTDAEGKPLTPEQIAATIIGDIANQTKAVTAIANSGVMTQLPEQLAQKILSLPPDAAVALANYFAANPAQLEQLTTNYNALATFTETALGVPMATTFATIGDTSAVEMMANARARITKAAERFRNFVQRQLSTDITVSVRYVAVNSIPGVSGGTIDVTARANGGTAFAGMPTLVGERGPEIIVPSVNSTVVRGEKTRQMMRGSGATINLTVNAGMGANGAEVGREIVDAIKRYERLSGPVFVSA
jgi:hypothetical protein